MLASLFSVFSSPVISLIAFLAIVSILVIAHELGHFISARLLGVGVEEFAIGLPLTEALWTVTRPGGLKISLYPVLFGGFVKLMGEESLDALEHPKVKKGETRGEQFWAQPVGSRFLIIIAGVTANLLFAILAFSAVFYFTGIPKDTRNLHVISVAPGSPAAQAGLKEGDIVTGLEYQPPTSQLAEGEAVTSADVFVNFVEKHKGQTLEIEFKRGVQTLRVDAVPRLKPPQGEGRLGVGITTTEFIFLPFYQMFPASLQSGTLEAWHWIQVIVSGSIGIIKELVGGTIPSEVGGPLRIAQFSGQVVRQGPITILSFLAILSINLAVINILPFPALDGGHAVFLIIEAVTGHRVAPKIEHWVHTIGLTILLILLFLITIHDAEAILGSHGILR